MNDLIVFALRDEAPNLFNKYRNVFCIGIGKVNAAINVTNLIATYNPNRVINLGTAGGITLSSGIHRVNNVIQHDVNLLAMGLEPGYIALDNTNVITFEGQGYTCATGDMHVTERHKLRVKCDMVDMECFSIAKSCLMAGVSCEIYKYISDQADENAATTWKEQVAAGEDLYVKVLQDLQATLEEK